MISTDDVRRGAGNLCLSLIHADGKRVPGVCPETEILFLSPSSDNICMD
ncbi:Uncharacterized protein dnm_065010 [Desulfonema magnum]|uniref:Uncharacterized protein n=1 Tax=Desulfonema magnum TaxID=45655 RepID=A0A975BRV7_9BACT|nr:Uncharacterized protein dnm_065010 [Desulfonema magnum]